ncbi:MAG TPA: hypothetical protein VHE34_27675 [Puia sp.]|uniref:DUF7010 family protein n=1 Tax=Puia sp. TaxID=2045100 RepID=UPI002C36A76D|nr:hypothetical protein [Puia sp.]HVU99045.1 hypothetical protein [Puia sp.]
MKISTVNDIEGIRGELFHMILFSMAWAMMGEYIIDFTDFAMGVILTLICVVFLALYSIRLYDLEGELEELGRISFYSDQGEKRRDRSYALILLFEGIAVLVSWSILLKYGHDNWVIPAFALIAGLHFIPLARLIRQTSYYYLGVWISLLAVVCYWLFMSGRIDDRLANTVIAYGCAAGSVLDGIAIIFRARRQLQS